MNNRFIRTLEEAERYLVEEEGMKRVPIDGPVDSLGVYETPEGAFCYLVREDSANYPFAIHWMPNPKEPQP